MKVKEQKWKGPAFSSKKRLTAPEKIEFPI